MTPQLLFTLKNKFAPAPPEPADDGIYYHPYPFGLEFVLIILLGIAGGLIFSNNLTPPTSGASGTSGSDTPPATINGGDEFSRAMPHILKWEGGCTDHPKDPGKRTYKGITLYEANRIGISDPCTMTDDQVLKVYRDRYWARVPKSLPFDKKLIYFNLIINGTKRRCLNKPTALQMLDCQQEHYDSIGSKDFANGWRRRNNYFKLVINKIK